MKKTTFQSLSKKQKKLARAAVLDTSMRRAEIEPTKAELRAQLAEAVRNTQAKGRAA